MGVAAMGGDSIHPGRSLTSHYPHCVGTRQLGTLPPADVIQNLGLSEFSTSGGDKQPDSGVGSLASIIPLLTSLPLGGDAREKGDTKPSRYLVAKGLPTLPVKLVDRIWNLEYIDMEEFLPAPRSLRLAEQGKPAPSLQESLVGAFNQFQAIQSQKTQRRVLDIITWMRCFTLYIAVMAKQRSDMVQCMVAHLHTVLKLHQKAPKSAAWLEYDIQFRMEMAAREDRVWTEGDPWQYVSCLPGPSTTQDPFDLAEIAAIPQVETNRPPLLAPSLAQDRTEPAVTLGKGKRPIDSTSGKAPVGGKPPATKKPKKGGTCRLFNKAPRGCPYGEECMFTHRCSNCGVLEAHGQLGCPLPPKYLQ